MNGISVVVCTYNGGSKLEAVLEHLISLQNACPWELIIVNNASTDRTAELCERFLSEKGKQIQWKIIHEATPGLIHARVCGLRAAAYEVVLFCDDDNLLASDYLLIGAELFTRNKSIGALGGCGAAAFEGAKPDWFDRYSHSFAVGPQADQDGKITHVPAEVYGAGTFVRKEPLLQFINKGFTASLTGRTGKKLVSGDDVEWSYLLQLAGYEIWYDHRLHFIHLMPENRMQWDYYLKLKEGIASGAARLFPYVCLIQNKNMSGVAFFIKWVQRLFMVTLVYLRNRMIFLVRFQSLTDAEVLSQRVLQARMVSYWTYSLSAARRFRYLKRFL